MKSKRVLFLFIIGIIAVMFVSCNQNKNNVAESSINKHGENNIRRWTVRKDMDSLLIIYTPQFKSIDLVCDTMPSTNDTNVIFCAEAAYTAEILKKFKHSNIMGDHVSKGKRYKGSPCKRNTGAFVFYNKTYKFLYKRYSNELDSAA